MSFNDSLTNNLCVTIYPVTNIRTRLYNADDTSAEKEESELSILVKKKKEESNSAYNSFIRGKNTRWGEKRKRHPKQEYEMKPYIEMSSSSLLINNLERNRSGTISASY